MIKSRFIQVGISVLALLASAQAWAHQAGLQAWKGSWDAFIDLIYLDYDLPRVGLVANLNFSGPIAGASFAG